MSVLEMKERLPWPSSIISQAAAPPMQERGVLPGAQNTVVALDPAERPVAENKGCFTKKRLHVIALFSCRLYIGRNWSRYRPAVLGLRQLGVNPNVNGFRLKSRLQELCQHLVFPPARWQLQLPLQPRLSERPGQLGRTAGRRGRS